MDITPSPALCDSAGQFASFMPWKILLYVKLGIAIVATAASFFLIKDVGCRWLVHPNAKVLFGNHIFWSALSPFLYVLLYVIDLIRLSQDHENFCEYLVTTKFALFFRTTHVHAAMAQNFSVLMLAIERFFSAFYMHKYEKITSPSFGVALLILAIFLCLILPYVIYITPFLGTPMLDGFSVVISHRNEYNKDVAAIVSYIQLITEFTALILFHGTLIYTKIFLKERLKMKVHSVSQAYQASETESVVRPLLFVFWTHFIICCLQAGATGSFKVLFGQNAPLTQFSFVLELFTQFPLYTIILTCLLHPRSCLRRKKAVVVTGVQQQDAYFHDLKQMFETTGTTESQKTRF